MRRMTWSILLAVALLAGAIALTLDTSPLLLAQGDPTGTPTATPTVCPMATPEPLWVDPVISPTDLLTQTIRVAIGNGDAVTVTTQTGVYTTTGTFGVMNPALVIIDLAPNATNALTVTAHVRQVSGPGGCPYGGYTISTITDRNGGPLVIVQQSATATPTPTVTATPTATPTTTPTVTPTICPMATPEPLWVDPVISPTDLLTQTIRVAIGNGDAVTVTTQTGVYTTTGTFGVMNPALVTIDLAPNATNALTVTAHVRQVSGPGGCPYGGYTISTITDRNGGPLVIIQQSATVTPTPTVTATPTATPTDTPTMTATPTATETPEFKQYLPYLARRAPGAPGAPELAIGLVLGGAMTLSWTAAPNATGYIVLQAATPDMANPVVLYRGAALSFTQTPPRGLHYFAVNAVNAVGLTLSNVVPLDYNPPPPGIGGRVTDNGAPAVGVLLRLRRFDGLEWITAAETTTAADGAYLFPGAAGLGAGEMYYVLYPNADGSTTRLGGYGTARLYSYAAGTRVDMSPFDITNIPLRSPSGGVTVSLPATFAWDRRGIAGDSYAWTLEQPTTNGSTVVYVGPQVGENEAYTLFGLPSGITLGIRYVWSVRVYGLPRDEANFGVARFVRSVTFSSSAKQTVIDATDARPSQGIERVFESVP